MATAVATIVASRAATKSVRKRAKSVRAVRNGERDWGSGGGGGGGGAWDFVDDASCVCCWDGDMLITSSTTFLDAGKW